MPTCLQCQCEIKKGELICPWCGASQKSRTNRLSWLLPTVALTALGSVGVVLTFPLLWDGVFHLGFQQPLLNLNRLEQLLQAGEWEQADRETSILLNQATQSDRDLYSGNLASNQTNRLSCADLQALNQLWLNYSSGRFGFSVQGEIYNATMMLNTEMLNTEAQPLKSPVVDPPPQVDPPSQRGSNNASSALQRMSDDLALEVDRQRAFRNQIGWGWYDGTTPPIDVNDPRINFSLTAPVGHLPSYGVFLSSPSHISPIFSADAFAARQQQCGL